MLSWDHLLSPFTLSLSPKGEREEKVSSFLKFLSSSCQTFMGKRNETSLSFLPLPRGGRGWR